MEMDCEENVVRSIFKIHVLEKAKSMDGLRMECMTMYDHMSFIHIKEKNMLRRL